MKRVTGIGGIFFKAKDAPSLQLISPQESKQFAPSSAPFMVNYRVEDLHALVDESAYGKFGWVIDPEGNKVELWQPPQGQ